GNWNVPQVVTVNAFDDNFVEGGHTGTIVHAVSSPDTNYDALPVPDVVANVTDNDIAGVVIAPSGRTTQLAEGGASDTHTITLQSQPVADVEITITSIAGHVLHGRPTPLISAPADWNAGGTVTVDADDDVIFEGGHIGTLTHSVA